MQKKIKHQEGGKYFFPALYYKMVQILVILLNFIIYCMYHPGGQVLYNFSTSFGSSVTLNPATPDTC